MVITSFSDSGDLKTDIFHENAKPEICTIRIPSYIYKKIGESKSISIILRPGKADMFILQITDLFF